MAGNAYGSDSFHSAVIQECTNFCHASLGNRNKPHKNARGKALLLKCVISTVLI